MTIEILTWLAVVSAYFLSRIAEIRTHYYNYDFIKLIGFEETIPWVMSIYYKLIYVILPLAFLEYCFSPFEVGHRLKFLAISMIMAGFLLRLWTIHVLGKFWTMRCIMVEHMPKRKNGPFRIFAHPEYVSRVIDGTGLCLLISAVYLATIYFILSLGLSLAIIFFEKKLFIKQPVTENI